MCVCVCIYRGVCVCVCVRARGCRCVYKRVYVCVHNQRGGILCAKYEDECGLCSLSQYDNSMLGAYILIIPFYCHFVVWHMHTHVYII